MDSFFSVWSLTKRLRGRLRRTGFQGIEPPRLAMRVLGTERLVLREFRQDDLRDLVSWQRDSGSAYTESEMQEFLNFCFREYLRRGIGPWGIVLRTTGIMVGSCSFYHIDSNHRSGDVNYYVTPQYRGQGLAVEALRAVLEFGFADVGLSRIHARCTPDNTGSERVMQKAGMKFERMVSSGEASKDGPCRYKLYTVIRRDFKL
jgi:ribosomal-protein-alanine N-acetyltransferase